SSAPRPAQGRSPRLPRHPRWSPSARDRGSELFEVRDVALSVVLGVRDRRRPGLLLGPGRLEHAAVLLEEPREVADPLVDPDRVAVLPHGLTRVDHGAFRAEPGHVARELVLLDDGVEA